MKNSHFKTPRTLDACEFTGSYDTNQAPKMPWAVILLTALAVTVISIAGLL